MKIDLTKIDDIEDLRSVPAGEYHCRAAECCESQSPAGHTRWGIRWEIVSGDFKGRTACWDSLHWSERGMPRLSFVLQMLGFPNEGGEIEIQPANIVDREALVEIVPEEREDPVSGIRRLMNRVPFAGYAPAPEKGSTLLRAVDSADPPSTCERVEIGDEMLTAHWSFGTDVEVMAELLADLMLWSNLEHPKRTIFADALRKAYDIEAEESR